MGRIEDALRKLEEESRNRSENSVPVSGAATKSRGHRSGGAPKQLSLRAEHSIDLDIATLRRWGPVLWDGADRIRKEYGQIKRPIVATALGKTAGGVGAGNIVLVTSALAGEGKSLTAMNLALSLALEKDLSVILVDADTVKPDLSRTLLLESAPGLTDLLASDDVGLADVLHSTSRPNLYFIPAGLHRSGAVELLGSQRMSDFLDALHRDLPHTIVVIDSSPLLLTNESPVLLGLVGQVVLVVRANQTPRLVVTEAIDRIDPAKPVGLVLNAASSGGMDSYGYYGAYGSDEAPLNTAD